MVKVDDHFVIIILLAEVACFRFVMLCDVLCINSVCNNLNIIHETCPKRNLQIQNCEIIYWKSILKNHPSIYFYFCHAYLCVFSAPSTYIKIVK